MNFRLESPALVERLLDEARSDRAAMEAKVEQLRQEAKADRAEMEARLDAKIAELVAPAPAAISDAQVAGIQARLEGLHVAKLLTDEVRACQCDATPVQCPLRPSLLTPMCHTWL